MKMAIKKISYVAAGIGVIAMALGLYWEMIKHDYRTLSMIAQIVGLILLIAGIVGLLITRSRTNQRSKISERKQGQ